MPIQLALLNTSTRASTRGSKGLYTATVNIHRLLRSFHHCLFLCRGPCMRNLPWQNTYHKLPYLFIVESMITLGYAYTSILIGGISPVNVLAGLFFTNPVDEDYPELHQDKSNRKISLKIKSPILRDSSIVSWPLTETFEKTAVSRSCQGRTELQRPHPCHFKQAVHRYQ